MVGKASEDGTGRVDQTDVPLKQADRLFFGAYRLFLELVASFLELIASFKIGRAHV